MTEPLARNEYRVLVVDDDVDFGGAIAEGLQMLGWCALSVDGGALALPLLKRRQCDALVTDLRMPGVNGLMVLSFAKEHVPDLPVIIMTAFSAIDAAVECVRRGAFQYVTKPFKIAELDLSLQRAFETRAVHRVGI